MKIIRELHIAIERRIEEVRARIVADAVKKFETEVRALVGNVALNVSSYYMVERMGPNLVITVKLEGK